MTLHSDLTGADLHPSKSVYPNGPETIPDNTANAYKITDNAGTPTDYVVITTTNGSETISWGNATTNPAHHFLGTGRAGFDGGLGFDRITTVNSTSPSDVTTSEHVILCDVSTAAGNITLNLPVPANSTGSTWVVKLISTGYDVILDRTNGGNIEGVGSNYTITGTTNQATVRVICDGTNFHLIEGIAAGGGGGGASANDNLSESLLTEIFAT